MTRDNKRGGEAGRLTEFSYYKSKIGRSPPRKNWELGPRGNLWSRPRDRGTIDLEEMSDGFFFYLTGPNFA